MHYELTLAERFWAKVKKTEDCWLWTAALNSDGYGSIPPHKAHRLSWQLHFGPIPDGLFVCHRCDVRHCVRPDHLFLGTQQDNVNDMRRKGRAVLMGAVRLSDSQIVAIRQRYANGGVTQRALAVEFGTSPSHINRIIHRHERNDVA